MEFQDIHYSARRGVFKANVAVANGAKTITFPCEIAGDPMMPAPRVVMNLRKRALKLSHS